MACSAYPHHKLSNRHNGGGNYAFLDGHAKWYKVETAEAGTKASNVFGHGGSPYAYRNIAGYVEP